MSLFSSYGDNNRVIDSPLCVTYTKNRVSGNYVGETTTASGITATYTEVMEYHRRATKCYRYIAMDYGTATICRDEMIAKYSRDFKMSTWDATTSDSLGLGTFVDSDAGNMLMAEVAMARNEDGSWDVVINVNEDDVRLRKIGYATSNPFLFASERSRGYDDETE